MATYVLVHGAWHGGWCWRDVAVELRAAGHHVGCHTDSHPWMTSLTPAQQRAEVITALRLHDRLGLPRRGLGDGAA